MKSLTKSSKSKLVAKDVQVEFSLPVAGVVRDVQSAFFGLCVGAGKAVLCAMMEEDRVALCGPKGVPDSARSASYKEGLAFERHRSHRLRAKNASKAPFASGEFRRSPKILAS